MSGVHVSHNLILECVIAEESNHVTLGAPRQGGLWSPTGTARVLRMTYPMIVTERGGMGISWDEEIPPRYEDVAWNAPPTFAQSESSADAENRRDSVEEIEALEGIRRPRPGSPVVESHRPSSAGSYFGTRHARRDSDTSAASN
jgi:arrestin-related trafficking adapter 1